MDDNIFNFLNPIKSYIDNQTYKCPRCGKVFQASKFLKYSKTTTNVRGNWVYNKTMSQFVCYDCYADLEYKRKKWNRSLLIIGSIVGIIAMIVAFASMPPRNSLQIAINVTLGFVAFLIVAIPLRRN